MSRSLRAPDLSRARELVLEHGRNATAYQLLNPGFRRWFSAAGDAVIGYVTYGRWVVVAGKPVCAPQRLAPVLAELAGATAGKRLCFFAAGAELEPPLAGLWSTPHRLLLGAQPVWRPDSWPRILAAKQSLRAQLHRATNKGVEIERWPAGRSSGRAELGAVLAEWLSTRGLPPLHFLVETDTLDRLDDRRVFVASRPGAGDGRPLAFLVASPIGARRGWLVEQIVRGRSAPNGTTELLLDAAMRAALESGDQLVTLGLAPLSRRAPVREETPSVAVRLVLRAVRELGRSFYDFEGLDAYKAKFVPDAWEPLYAFSREPVGLRTLWAFAGAFGGVSPVWLMVRALRRRPRQR